MDVATFRVDPRLASILGENYRSTEKALKELVDNSWDADAESVWIVLPAPFEEKPIVIRDDGSGMTEREIRGEYLLIASARASRKGERTALKGRPVKGRKGIGKFAGLVAADTMDIETEARGVRSRLSIEKQRILDGGTDLEQVPLPLATEPCDLNTHGTTVTLSNLSQRFVLPSPEKLKELLVLEYGREAGFTIYVNEERVAAHDLPGDGFEDEVDLPEAGHVHLRFTILQEPRGAKRTGIIARVRGRTVGNPGFFGIEDREDVPAKLLNRIVGEIEADGLEDDVTADWGALIENSTAYKEVRRWANERISAALEDVCAREINLARARMQKEINTRLQQLPEHRRRFASEAMDRVLRRFYGESQEKIGTVVSLVLDALERDEYWQVCETIRNTPRADVVTFAEALEAFGLLEMALVARQATARLQFLDSLDELIGNPKTLEKQMHQALASNLWVFGTGYSLMASNVTLAKAVGSYLDRKFTGARAKKRPDLFLAQDATRRFALIEFKRPSAVVGREAEAQAKEYRDDLTPNFGPIGIMVVGGSVDATMSSHYDQADVQFRSYASIISDARAQLEWLLQGLKSEKDMVLVKAGL